MLRAAIGFFVLALLALLLGANGIAGISMEVGKLLVFVFLVISVLSLLAGLFGGGGKRRW